MCAKFSQYSAAKTYEQLKPLKMYRNN